MILKELEQKEKKRQDGIYLTTYGNTCEVIWRDDYAFNLDMGEVIPIQCVDPTQFIRPLE